MHDYIKIKHAKHTDTTANKSDRRSDRFYALDCNGETVAKAETQELILQEYDRLRKICPRALFQVRYVELNEATYREDDRLRLDRQWLEQIYKPGKKRKEHGKRGK